MKKKSALLALLLAGLMSVSVIGTAGCKKHVDKGDNTDQTDTENNGGDNTDPKPNPNPGDNTDPKPNPNPDDKDPENPDDKDPENPDPGDKDPEKPDPGEEQPEPVVVTSDTAISLVAGQSRALTASEGVTWTSSDSAVATVNSSGLVTAKTAGVTKVKATKAGEEITCTVIVLSAQQTSSSGTSKQPFSFNESRQIGSVQVSGGGPVASNPDASEYTVSFSDGVVDQRVAKGSLAVEPLVENEGHYLQGWYTDSGYANEYDFNEPVTQTLNLYAKWGDAQGFNLIEGNFESIALEWSGSATAVEYKLKGESNWTAIDEELVRANGGTVRADILGLRAGVYDVKANGKTITDIPVKAYDRSGYAHFKYTDGVGAYNDDGTLKDNALVVYVTDQNKDTVMAEVAEKNEDVSIFKVPHYTGANAAGKDWGDKNATGIGWWLNNNQYTSNNATSSKNKNPSNTYDPVNGGKLGFKMVDRPIVIRFLGTVSTPEGCTAYNHTDEGGGVGDNGHMARMKNLKNITLEGIGDDAVIQGWGFHFVAGGDAVNGQGKSFEVRNLTFNEYPEDAIGMEGQATSKKITAPVERCWIHNNTFLPGRCDNPAESDKKEGDGSCDFKRGYYFTCSYNYFEYCHKTNLIGSSDDSLQYNLTYHHNLWYQCGSRIPLTRQANVHFYNNYVFGDPANTATPYSHISKASLSYVHSLRASCYLFSENNYYDGCKNLLRGASEGGDGKFYGNAYYACADTKAPVTEVRTRTQAVTNKSLDPTTGTSYSTFDTDKNLFYYDAQNQRTDALLDDAVSARIRACLYSGAQGHGRNKTAKLQEMNTNPAKVITSLTSPVKGKGQVVTFSVAADQTTLVVNATGESPQVIRNDGKIVVDTFSGERTVMLNAGTYMVCAGKKDKEITVNSLTVQEDTEAAKKARVEKAKKAISDIPDTITRSSGSIIAQAEAAYANLITASGREELGEEYTQRLQKAQKAYEEIQIAYVIARIDYIGTVTELSKSDIEAAEAAYKLLHGSVQSQVTNYNKLVQANAEFAKFATANAKYEIERLPLSTNLDLVLDSKPAIELAIGLYEDALDVYTSLSEEQQKGVSVENVNKSLALLKDAMAKIEQAEKEARNMASFIETLDAINADAVDMTKAGQLKALYEALTAEQKQTVTAEQKAKYDKVMEAYTEFMSKAVTISFTSGKDDYYTNKADYIAISGKTTNVTEKLNGVDYTTAVKFESSTRVTIKASGNARKIVLHLASGASGSLKDANNANNVYKVEGTTVTIMLEANKELVLTKKDGTKNYLFFIEMLPV